jgi:hypothetical protein
METKNNNNLIVTKKIKKQKLKNPLEILFFVANKLFVARNAR